MTFSRRSVVVSTPCAAAGVLGSPVAAFAGPGFAGMVASLGGNAPVRPSRFQQFSTLLIHQEQGADAPAYATITLPSGEAAWASLGHLNSHDYLQARDRYASRGYRMRQLKAFQTAKGMNYAAIWQYQGYSNQNVQHDMSVGQFQSRASRLNRAGYRLISLQVAPTAAGPRCAAIWERGAPTQTLCLGLDAGQFSEKVAAMAGQGLQARLISGFMQDGQPRFAAVFEKGGKRVALHQMTPSELRDRSEAMATQGFGLTDANGYVEDGRPVLSGVWEKA